MDQEDNHNSLQPIQDTVRVNKKNTTDFAAAEVNTHISKEDTVKQGGT